MPPPLGNGAISVAFVRPSVAYIANNSRTQKPSVPKFGRKVPHLTWDSHTSFKVKRSLSLNISSSVTSVRLLTIAQTATAYRWNLLQVIICSTAPPDNNVCSQAYMLLYSRRGMIALLSKVANISFNNRFIQRRVMNHLYCAVTLHMHV